MEDPLRGLPHNPSRSRGRVPGLDAWRVVRRLGGRAARLHRRRQDGDAGGQWQGPQRPRAGSEESSRRQRRPRGQQQHEPQGRRRFQRHGERPQLPLRRARARHGRGAQRHEPPWRAPPLWRHLPPVRRLHAVQHPPGLADEAAGRLCLHPRQHRPRRGWPHPPARRACDGPSSHPRPLRDPPRGCGGDERSLARGASAQGRPHGAHPHASETAHRHRRQGPRHGEGRLCARGSQRGGEARAHRHGI